MNLLLHAVNSDSTDHDAALRWWTDMLESHRPVGLYTGVVFGFVRLSTHHRVFHHPLTVAEAFAYIDNWLGFPAVRLIETNLEDLATAERLLTAAGTGGNLVSDAQIAAASLRMQATVHSTDADFSRFPGVEWENPLG